MKTPADLSSGCGNNVGFCVLGMNMGMLVRMPMRVYRTPLVRMMVFGTVDMQRACAADRARQRGRPNRLIDDLANGASAAAALGATTQTTVNVTGGTTIRGARSVAHLLVGQHIAGANDHLIGQLNVRPDRVN
jgi:hypothetical protein